MLRVTDSSYFVGIGTASVYCDKKLRKGGFEFECEKQLDRVLAVKTHSASLEKFERVIMIIRNPYEAMLAFFHFMYSGYHTGQTKDKNFFNGGKKNSKLSNGDNLHKMSNPVFWEK